MRTLNIRHTESEKRDSVANGVVGINVKSVIFSQI